MIELVSLCCKFAEKKDSPSKFFYEAFCSGGRCRRCSCRSIEAAVCLLSFSPVRVHYDFLRTAEKQTRIQAFVTVYNLDKPVDKIISFVFPSLTCGYTHPTLRVGKLGL